MAIDATAVELTAPPGPPADRSGTQLGKLRVVASGFGLGVTQLRFVGRRRLFVCVVWAGQAKAERLPARCYPACLSSHSSRRKAN